MPAPPRLKPEPCPCGSGRAYEACCGRYHAGSAAPDAEALMRSRYTAFVRHDEAYLLATWHPGRRPASLDLTDDPPTKWLGLNVIRHERSAPDAAVVEFVARYKVNGRAFRLHETSRFVLEDGRWLYVEGEVEGRRQSLI